MNLTEAKKRLQRQKTIGFQKTLARARAHDLFPCPKDLQNLDHNHLERLPDREFCEIIMAIIDKGYQN